MKLGKIASLFSKKINIKPFLGEKDNNQQVEAMQAELKDVKTKKERLEKYLEGLKQRQGDLKKYESLTEEDHTKVAGFLDKYKNVLEERRRLEGRLIKNNPALRVIQAREKEIPQIIQEMQKTENSQRYAHSDTLYLEEERDSLYQYREDLIAWYRALKIFSISLIIILGIVLVVLLTMVQALRENIYIPSSVIAITTLLIGFGILVTKGRIERELELNERMQQRASKLLKKAKIRYFHHTNYLDFQYTNLSVKNSAHLQVQFQRYLKNKNNEKYYGKMNNQLIEIENRLFEFLYDKGIERDAFDNIDEWAEVQNIAILLKNIKQECENTKRQIKALSSYQEELSKEIFLNGGII